MLYEILILVLAVPVGFLVGWWARDELLGLREWFKWLIVFSIVVGIGACLFDYSVVGWTLGFVAVVSFVSYWKSFDGEWTKKV